MKPIVSIIDPKTSPVAIAGNLPKVVKFIYGTSSMLNIQYINY